MSWRGARWLGLWLLLSGPAHADVAPWALEVPERVTLAVGEVAQLPLVLRAGGRYQVAPVGVVLELTPPERGLGLRQRRYQRGDAGGDEGVAAALPFEVSVRGEAAGSYELGVRARFWACTARLCVPVDQRRSVAITVAPPAPPPAVEPSTAPAPAPPPAAPTRRRPGPAPKPASAPVSSAKP